MTRRKEMEDRKDPAWLNSPQKAEIDKVLRDMETEQRHEKKRKKENAKSS